MANWALNWVRANETHKLQQLPNADVEYRSGGAIFTYNHCECACRPYVDEARTCPFCWGNGRRSIDAPAVSVPPTPDAKGKSEMSENFETVLKAKDQIIAVLNDEIDRLRDSVDVLQDRLDKAHNRLHDQLNVERKLHAACRQLTDVASASNASLGGIIDLIQNDTSVSDGDIAAATVHHEDGNGVLTNIRETLDEL